MRIFEATRTFVVTYTAHISVGAFLVGFILDNLALPRIDNPVAHLIIISYLVIAGAGILLTAVSARDQARMKTFARVAPFLPPIIQFIFGGLYSALFVYYFRSASLLSSWAFLLMLLIMIVGNEVFRRRYDRLPFQIGVFFATLFGFMIFYVPILFQRLDVMMFLLSGAASLVIITFFVGAVFVVAPTAVREVWKNILVAVVGIFLCLNTLYVTKSIPPIPLVLITAETYHGISKDEIGTYLGREEERSWYGRHIAVSPPHHYVSGEPVYFYSAVFAPTKFAVPVYHEWQYRDDANGEWVTSMRVSFSIYGGRGGGYRGYSVKNNVTPGRWRVRVVTENGQLIGQRAFTLVPTDHSPPLYEKEL